MILRDIIPPAVEKDIPYAFAGFTNYSKFTEIPL
jgi:hypothetical protein